MEHLDLQEIRQWRMGRFTDAADSALTDYKASEFSTLLRQGRILNVAHHAAIAMRAWGQGTSGNVNQIVLVGWMSLNTKTGCGPGQKLWKGNLVLGTHELDENPTAHGEWTKGVAGSSFYEMSDWDSSVAGGYDITGSVELQTAQQSLLLLPTLGYPFLSLEVPTLGSTNMGILFRGASKGGIIT